jgi:hypothetical protein
VYRILIGKWGIMSINYQTTDAGRQLADAITEDTAGENVINVDVEAVTIDEETGEVIE